MSKSQGGKPSPAALFIVSPYSAWPGIYEVKCPCDERRRKSCWWLNIVRMSRGRRDGLSARRGHALSRCQWAFKSFMFGYGLSRDREKWEWWHLKLKRAAWNVYSKRLNAINKWRNLKVLLPLGDPFTKTWQLQLLLLVCNQYIVWMKLLFTCTHRGPLADPGKHKSLVPGDKWIA